MKRDFDYTQKVLIAIEYNDKPSNLPVKELKYSIFQRIPISSVKEAFSQEVNPFLRLLIARKFSKIIEERMGYWESRIPPNQSAFVHYFIGNENEIALAYEQLQQFSFAMMGVYHIEPQSSSYPFGFPSEAVPSTYYLGEVKPYTEKSLFWFNFFPEQRYLFEKTFRIWCIFQLSKLKQGGDCNQLVALDGKNKFKIKTLDEFVQINLNRFNSFKGYFLAAKEAGKQSFTKDKDYKWYGMLLKKIK